MDEIIMYQTSNGSLELKNDPCNETAWVSRMQMAEIFDVQPQAITKHIKNIYEDFELEKKSTSSKMELVQLESGRTVKRQVDFYNLEMVISVGYRINSIKATKFRQWATKTLKQHITEGYTINVKALEKNKTQFLQTLEDLKVLAQNNTQIETPAILSLIQSFSDTFFALDSFDKNEFPKQGDKKEIKTNAIELKNDLRQLKLELIKKGEATELFAQEKKQGNLEGIFGNVFQSVFGEDAYPTVEEKAAHLLYFIIKNHPFNDGNKRSGAFSFVWLLHKAGYDFSRKISPETLTTLTILIAESNPADKEKMVGIVKLLLKNQNAT
jgi:death-on-curing family protein